MLRYSTVDAILFLYICVHVGPNIHVGGLQGVGAWLVAISADGQGGAPCKKQL